MTRDELRSELKRLMNALEAVGLNDHAAVLGVLVGAMQEGDEMVHILATVNAAVANERIKCIKGERGNN